MVGIVRPYFGGATIGAPDVAEGPGNRASDTAPTVPDPKQVVRRVVESAGWPTAESGDTWRITVPIGSRRTQTVCVEFGGQDDDGQRIIALRSLCGPAMDENAMALLRLNARIVHASFAVQKVGGEEMVVAQANQLADTADALEVRRAVAAVARRADMVEKKLVRDDRY